MSDAGVELERIVEAITAAVGSASLSEASRKRVPNGFDAQHPRARFLLRDGLHLSGVEPTPGSITTSSFADHVADRLAAYVQLQRWLAANT